MSKQDNRHLHRLKLVNFQNMKFYTFLAYVIVGLTPCLGSKDFESKLVLCAKEQGFDKATLEKMLNNNDSRLACLAACVLVKDKIIVNNKIDIKMAIEIAENEYGLSNKEELENIITLCATQANKKDDMCSKAGELVKCVIDKTNK